jgi:DNA (cytosine-5)-methyltransferase 1
MLTSRGLGTVLGDLAALGFDARWGVISAADVGAPHLRERIWIVATNTGYQQPRQQENGFRQERDESIRPIIGDFCENLSDSNSDSQSTGAVNAKSLQKLNMGHTDSTQREGNKCAKREQPAHANIGSAGWWITEPDVGRVANGVAARMDRLKAIGNGQVPAVAATAFRLLGGFHD